MTTKTREISIWFFIGVSLAVNGFLISVAGLYDFINPVAHPVVLARLHASLWWGLFLFVLGAFYCVQFSPLRHLSQEQSAESLKR
jgi:hypothetical protein